MKFITEFYGETAKKSASKELIAKLKEIEKRQKESRRRCENCYSRENILKYWKSEEDTGFYLLTEKYFRTHNNIGAKVKRIPEFEESIAKDRGYINERKPTKNQRATAQCFMSAGDNIGGCGDNAEYVMVEAYTDIKPGDMVSVAIPEDLDAYEMMVENAVWAERQLEIEREEKKENARRSETMTITVGMWEDLLHRIEELEG